MFWPLEMWRPLWRYGQGRDFFFKLGFPSRSKPSPPPILGFWDQIKELRDLLPPLLGSYHRYPSLGIGSLVLIVTFHPLDCTNILKLSNSMTREITVFTEECFWDLDWLKRVFQKFMSVIALYSIACAFCSGKWFTDGMLPGENWIKSHPLFQG